MDLPNTLCLCVNSYVCEKGEGQEETAGKTPLSCLEYEKEHNLFKNIKSVSNGMSITRQENGEKGH